MVIKKIYWNYATGGVECEKTDNNCPIIKSPNDDDIVIESWWTDCTHSHAINFAYERDSFHEYRDRFFKKNKVNPQELRWLMIPKSEYEQLMEYYNGLDKEESEE